ncbi:MAG: ABC transporter ATP-binding protein [Deltaproteobacteria bacterium]|jgi:iron complex transport system ATP-binding protein|nr:ABC transporter ATP-binding protein [Deltaproteobacteria bacterium]
MPNNSVVSAIEAKDLSFSIDGVDILRHVSFNINKGDFMSIMGPNGAGKSTLLKCLMRLYERGRTDGVIKIYGQDIKSYPQKKLARLISYVPQGGGWIPPFTVAELCKLSRFPYTSAVSGLTEADERAVAKAIELTDLAPLAKRALKTLSGGERQKAYLAAALAQETSIMLLDEPSASLDPRHAYELSELLRRLNSQNGLTILIITHDLNQPLRAGGTVLMLVDGQRTFFGPASGLLTGHVLEDAFRHEFLYLDHPSGQGQVIISR